MNIWSRASVTENPYVRTAFRVCRVPRETVSRRTIVQLIGRARNIVNTDAQSHTIRGKPVTLEEINTAEAIILSAENRILEELIFHATEVPALKRVREITREAAKAMAAEDASSLPVTNLKALRPLLLELVRKYLDDVKSPNPAFGALEMDLVPPFGQKERE